MIVTAGPILTKAAPGIEVALYTSQVTDRVQFVHKQKESPILSAPTLPQMLVGVDRRLTEVNGLLALIHV